MDGGAATLSSMRTGAESTGVGHRGGVDVPSVGGSCATGARSVPVLGAAAAFGVATAIAAHGVPSWERTAFHSVNDLPGWLEPVLWPPMQLGSLWGPLLAGWWTWRRWRSWRPTLGVVLGGVVSWQLAKGVKAIARRGRPADELDRLSRRMGTPTDGLGFVSGHTTVAFSMVTVLWPHVGNVGKVGLATVASVVALARIHVGAHLPVDTVGGAALGVLVGEAWRALAPDVTEERP